MIFLKSFYKHETCSEVLFETFPFSVWMISKTSYVKKTDNNFSVKSSFFKKNVQIFMKSSVSFHEISALSVAHMNPRTSSPFRDCKVSLNLGTGSKGKSFFGKFRYQYRRRKLFLFYPANFFIDGRWRHFFKLNFNSKIFLLMSHKI